MWCAHLNTGSKGLRQLRIIWWTKRVDGLTASCFSIKVAKILNYNFLINYSVELHILLGVFNRLTGDRN